MKKNISAEEKFIDIAEGMALDPETGPEPDKPVIMLKRIGSTNYEVAVHFSKTSKETVGEKITQLVKREASGQ